MATPEEGGRCRRLRRTVTNFRTCCPRRISLFPQLHFDRCCSPCGAAVLHCCCPCISASLAGQAAGRCERARRKGAAKGHGDGVSGLGAHFMGSIWGSSGCSGIGDSSNSRANYKACSAHAKFTTAASEPCTPHWGHAAAISGHAAAVSGHAAAILGHAAAILGGMQLPCWGACSCHVVGLANAE